MLTKLLNLHSLVLSYTLSVYVQSIFKSILIQFIFTLAARLTKPLKWTIIKGEHFNINKYEKCGKRTSAVFGSQIVGKLLPFFVSSQFPGSAFNLNSLLLSFVFYPLPIVSLLVRILYQTHMFIYHTEYI